jgi:hypothetical protein
VPQRGGGATQLIAQQPPSCSHVSNAGEMTCKWLQSQVLQRLQRLCVWLL